MQADSKSGGACNPHHDHPNRDVSRRGTVGNPAAHSEERSRHGDGKNRERYFRDRDWEPCPGDKNLRYNDRRRRVLAGGARRRGGEWQAEPARGQRQNLDEHPARHHPLLPRAERRKGTSKHSRDDIAMSVPRRDRQASRSRPRTADNSFFAGARVTLTRAATPSSSGLSRAPSVIRYSKAQSERGWQLSDHPARVRSGVDDSAPRTGGRPTRRG